MSYVFLSSNVAEMGVHSNIKSSNFSKSSITDFYFEEHCGVFTACGMYRASSRRCMQPNQNKTNCCGAVNDLSFKWTVV